MNQPNILIVLSDQLCRRALGCYGDANGVSGQIDQLAREGTRFTQASSTYPICVPFRFTLLTGQYAHSRRVPGIGYRMSPAERTLADEFNEAGYDTTYIGKWHLWGGMGPWAMKRPVPREHQGRWGKWLGFEFRNDFFDSVYFEDDDPTPHELPGYQTDGLFDLAIQRLTRRGDSSRPFCAVLSVEAPHPPVEAPAALEKKWLATDLKLPSNFMIPPDYPVPGRLLSSDDLESTLRRRRIYYAMIENLDQNVGKLRTALRDSGLDRNTIVVFMSDHGEMGGCHAMFNKQQPFEESIGVPLIVWGPGCGIPAGRTVDEPVCTVDLFPTFCGLGGLTPRDPLHGLNTTALIRARCDRLDRPGVMLEFVQESRPTMPFYHEPYRGFRSRRYKYTVKFAGQTGLQPWQFFDLESDPGELTNLIEDASSSQAIAEHHGWLRQRMIDTGDDEWLAAAFGHEEINRWQVFNPRG
jgi:arylsulfatase A-like enzyme